MLKVDGVSGGSIKPSPIPDLNNWFSLLLVAHVAIVDEILSGREVKWDMAYILFGLHGDQGIYKSDHSATFA